MNNPGWRSLISMGAMLTGACADDSAATARDDAEPAVVGDAAAPAVDAWLDRDERIPSSPPDRGATPADAALPDLRLADVPAVADLGGTPDALRLADAEQIVPDGSPPPVACVPVPHAGDLPATAQPLLRSDVLSPFGQPYRADGELACGDNWFGATAPVSGDRACLTQYVSTASVPPSARLESFEVSEPILACMEDADCAEAGVGFTCEATSCMRGVGAFLNAYTKRKPQDGNNVGYFSVNIAEIGRGTTSATPLLFRVSLDALPQAGIVNYTLRAHFASEAFGCPFDWQEELDDLVFIEQRGAVCDRWLCAGEFTDGFLTETVPDGVQALVLVPTSAADELELRAGQTVVRVPGADRQCIVLRGVEQTREGIVTVARPHDLAMDLADYTLIYDQAPDADPATLCASLGAPALAECPPGTLVAEDCWPVVDVDDAQF